MQGKYAFYEKSLKMLGRKKYVNTNFEKHVTFIFNKRKTIIKSSNYSTLRVLTIGCY